MNKILIVFGTRPEAIKMAILIKTLKAMSQIVVKVCITSQHREMLQQILAYFDIKPDYDLDVMVENQSLEGLTSSIMTGVSLVIDEFDPSMVLVHGDTTTAFAASLASYYKKIKIVHIEAGLRTGNLYEPYPEEMNRKFIGVVASIHFTPTEKTKQNLLNEGVANKNIFVVGNTVIDSLIYVRDRLENFDHEQFYFLESRKKLILVTSHRRENFGDGLKNICHALLQIALRDDVQIIYPVHPNPNVKEVVYEFLGNQENIFLVDPLDYFSFVYLMNCSYLILTDSGGIQEEAPSLGKPVLVMRNNTERPEAIDSGAAILVGTNMKKIVKKVEELLDDNVKYNKISKIHNPYGDGSASYQISEICKDKLL